MLNAGAASFVTLDWFKFIATFILHPVVTLTVVSYIVQAIGERSNDGFGYIWQCNVFGPYLFVSSSSPQPVLCTHRTHSQCIFHQYRELQPLLEAFHSRSDVRDHHYPSRVLWTTSLEATHFYRPHDWQPVETDHSYEASKYQIELLATQLEERALRSEEQTDRPAKVRHVLIHPGVASSGIAVHLVSPIIASLMGLGLLIVINTLSLSPS